MLSSQLSAEIKDIVLDAQARVMGVGHAQYATGDVQKFETLPLHELFVNAEEELLDIVNYATMLIIRLRRLANALP